MAESKENRGAFADGWDLSIVANKAVEVRLAVAEDLILAHQKELTHRRLGGTSRDPEYTMFDSAMYPDDLLRALIHQEEDRVRLYKAELARRHKNALSDAGEI